MELKKAAVEFVTLNHYAGEYAIRLILFETNSEVSECQNAPCWQVRDIIEFDPARIDLLTETMLGEEGFSRDYPGDAFEEIIISPHTENAPRITVGKPREGLATHYARLVIEAAHTQWLRDIITREAI